MAADNFWNNREQAQKLIDEANSLRGKTEPLLKAEKQLEDFQVMVELGEAEPEAAQAKVQQELEKLPGRHLALVRYAADHDPKSVEWVYNAADIDDARVVWAREMSPAKDRELLDYFRNRNVWLVEPDQAPPRVSLHVTHQN